VKFQHGIEKLIFGARWLLAPLYVGLIVVLLILAYKFVYDLVFLVIHVVEQQFADNSHAGDSMFIIDLLSLLDLVLISNLILIVLFAGYENFVSKIEVAENSVDRPAWMGSVDFSGLKIKLIGSLVAISVISLLASFISLSLNPEQEVGPALFWQIIIHLTFVVSGVMFAVMDWISDSRALRAKALHGGDAKVVGDGI
jgi:uncharacterized protein (TIGR00645 family)